MSVREKDKMYFYESFAEDFDAKMNMYDTLKRVEVVYQELLTEDIAGKKLLDAGSGTGWFSKAACERGAIVTSMDLGENLLAQVAKKCKSERIIGSILEIPFEENTFDYVVSSEVIEHTPDPLAAIDELYRVLKPGGIMVLTTPNRFWFFSIWIADKLKLRPYEGYENWVSWRALKRKTKYTGFTVESMVGIHLFPFVSRIFYPILDFFHRFNRSLGPVMLNMAIKGRKD
ncbi:MAG: class I SAM-dependent methyltransferase [Bacteroidetes bacterium]|nr:class I SAM-dependent methyltransferase [Bacteroidota bacterium]